MKKSLWIVFAVILLCVGTAGAQELERVVPMLERGTREVGLTGYIDFEGTAGGVDVELDARYGYFLDRHLEIGGFGTYSRAMDGDVLRYGLGGFAEYHIFGASLVRFAETVPYFGADLGLYALDWDRGEDQNAVSFVPRVGIKWFFREYLAIDTNFYLGLATDDIYINDNDSESYDFGIKIGLRVFF